MANMANVVRGIFLILLGLFFVMNPAFRGNETARALGGMAILGGFIELFRGDKKEPK